MKSRSLSSIFFPICTSILFSPLAFGGFTIQFTTLPDITDPDNPLDFPTAAAPALTRAANLWGQYITDNITVEISVGFGSMPVGKLGGASTYYWSDQTYANIAGAMIADATASSSLVDDEAKLLPGTAEDFKGQFPSDPVYTPNGLMNITTANYDALFGETSGTDAVVTFSNTYVFDFDNSDGVTGYDFESVVAHEIGHVLGFFSSLDFVPAPKPEQPTPLDLFRFSKDDPSKRSLTVGAAAVTDGGIFSYEMSTGVAGDGYQASHWKNGLSIGLMTPALETGVILVPSVADLRALDLIGYNVNYSPVPETTTFCSGLLLLLGVFRRRRVL